MTPNLHTHTCFSKLDGYKFPIDHVRRAKELGMSALAITDHGVLFGAFAHYRACLSEGIKPIIGMETYLAPGELTRERTVWGQITEEGRTKSVPGAYTHLTVLAEDAAGLRNLYKLHALSYTDGYYFEPRVSRDMLADHSEGLIILSGCVGGEVATRLRLEQFDEALECASWFKGTFPGRYYIEIMEHGLDFEIELNLRLIDLAEILDIPLVATQDNHYPNPEDAYAHDAMLCIQTRTEFSDPKRFKFSNNEFYLKDMGDSSLPKEAFENAQKIADSIQSYDDVFSHKNLMPKGSIDELRSKAEAGLFSLIVDRMDYEPTEHYWERLDYELEVIGKKEYAGYFLALEDICSWADSMGIFRGAGRGSGGASLVAYALGITKIDPLVHSLLFERFLNEERQSMPDIDLDFESARRDEVFAYAITRFGWHNSCQILTLGTIATRKAIQDAAKVLGHDIGLSNRLKSLVPPPKRGRTPTLDEIPVIGAQAPDVYDLAKELEGQIRHTGVHAGGLVISPVPLSEVIPVFKPVKGDTLISGYTMGELEELGLCKNDLLGVTTLDVLKTALEHINA